MPDDMQDIKYETKDNLYLRFFISILFILVGFLLGGGLSYGAWLTSDWCALSFCFPIAFLLVYAGITVAIVGLANSLTLTRDSLTLVFPRRTVITIKLADIQSIHPGSEYIWVKTIKGKNYPIDYGLFPSFEARDAFIDELNKRWASHTRTST